MEILIIWLMGVVDRIRGDDYDLAFDSRITDKVTYGFLVAALTGHVQYGAPYYDFLTPFIIIAFFFGISFGWGNAIGSAIRGIKPKDDPGKKPWWTIKNSAYLSLMIRGLLTGATLAPLFYFEWRLVFVSLAYMIAFPLAVLIAKLVTRDKEKYHVIWERQEMYRGWIAGTLIYQAYLWI